MGDGKYYRRSQCKDCQSQYNHNYAINPEHKKKKAESMRRRRPTSDSIYKSERNNSWRKNGIINKNGTPFRWENYLELLKICEYQCQGCGVSTPGNLRDWAVDHNHQTGIVRGILCSNCNITIGMSHESIDILTNLILYLQRFN